MRRSWLIAGVVVGIVAIVVAVVLVRASDEDSEATDTAAWAESVCSSLASWRSSIMSLADVSGETLTADLLRERLEEADAATDELVADLRELGPPDVEAGEEVERALDDAAAGLESSYESLKQAAQDALDAESPTEFLEALAGLGDDFQGLLDRVEETVAALQSASLFGESSAELEQAFANSGSCQQLRQED